MMSGCVTFLYYLRNMNTGFAITVNNSTYISNLMSENRTKIMLLSFFSFSQQCLCKTVILSLLNCISRTAAIFIKFNHAICNKVN